MPSKLPSPCRHPGCPALVKGGGYCDKHKRQERKRYDEKRGTAVQRGYDARWQKVRGMYLREHPLCEMCQQENRITPATMVHHVQPIRQGGAVLDTENLMAVCRRCHDRLHSNCSVSG